MGSIAGLLPNISVQSEMAQKAAKSIGILICIACMTSLGTGQMSSDPLERATPRAAS
jgi:hypothetical protein